MSDEIPTADKQELPVIEEQNTDTASTNNAAGGAAQQHNMDALFDINVNVSIVVGTKQMKLKDIMKLAKDNVLELDKLAGDPLDIMVNGSLIAHGEIVVANEKYGIRITDIAGKNDQFGGMAN